MKNITIGDLVDLLADKVAAKLEPNKVEEKTSTWADKDKLTISQTDGSILFSTDNSLFFSNSTGNLKAEVKLKERRFYKVKDQLVYITKIHEKQENPLVHRYDVDAEIYQFIGHGVTKRKVYRPIVIYGTAEYEEADYNFIVDMIIGFIGNNKFAISNTHRYFWCNKNFNDFETMLKSDGVTGGQVLQVKHKSDRIWKDLIGYEGLNNDLVLKPKS